MKLFNVTCRLMGQGRGFDKLTIYTLLLIFFWYFQCLWNKQVKSQSWVLHFGIIVSFFLFSKLFSILAVIFFPFWLLNKGDWKSMKKKGKNGPRQRRSMPVKSRKCQVEVKGKREEKILNVKREANSSILIIIGVSFTKLFTNIFLGEKKYLHANQLFTLNIYFIK